MHGSALTVLFPDLRRHIAGYQLHETVHDGVAMPREFVLGIIAQGENHQSLDAVALLLAKLGRQLPVGPKPLVDFLDFTIIYLSPLRLLPRLHRERLLRTALNGALMHILVNLRLTTGLGALHHFSKLGVAPPL